MRATALIWAIFAFALVACGPFALPAQEAAEAPAPEAPRLNAPSQQAVVVGTPQADISAADRA